MAEENVTPASAEKELKAAKEFAEFIVDTVRETMLVLSTDLKVKSANQ